MLAARRGLSLRVVVTRGALVRPVQARYSSTTHAGAPQAWAKWRNVRSLMDPPTLLEPAVKQVLEYESPPSWLCTALATELGSCYTVENRWDHIRALLALAKLPQLDAVFQPTHAEAIAKIPSALQEAGEKKREFGRMLGRVFRMRYPDAPFATFNDFKGAEPHLPQTSSAKLYLHAMPEVLVRLGLAWEREALARRGSSPEAERQRAADAIRSVYDHITSTDMGPRNDPDLNHAFLTAFAATRVAPQETARHWKAIVERNLPLRLFEIEHGLAAPRDLDTLRSVWADIVASKPWSTANSNTDRMRNSLYVQHLVRVGALDEAEQQASKFQPHAAAQWVLRFAKKLPFPTAIDMPQAGHARVEMRRAELLAANGLDSEAILFVLSLSSPFAESLHKRPSKSTRQSAQGSKDAPK
ncbi:hypothetical protein EXIGLDRAFT_772367 [Exidia glandulosa HHB12029]|uniref:Uncharacterized protein n=1 Tax=Exidia glandulosa HHB12029 TaxID=1314781 RepID=A0A165FCR1_EXIGL|nr:hypothetical protein EXIGLDRAFT_772367 [Exidia glandulosa HHB12029]